MDDDRKPGSGKRGGFGAARGGAGPAKRDQGGAGRSHDGAEGRFRASSDKPGAAPRKPSGKRPETPPEPGERIAKRLARAGIASRRDAEDLIASGRISVNGQKLTTPALNVTPQDRIEIDGTPIPEIERTRLFLFHKPAGVVTTNRDPEGRKTVFDVLPADLPRLMTIGRLDINTEGLLLLTNDGGLSRVLELPATGWLRRYRVRVHGKVDEKMLPSLKDGIAVNGVFYGSVEATLDREQGSNAWMTIGLREGKNREVKNILGALGLEVSRLIRLSYGPFQLAELPEGHVLEVAGRMLRDQLGERLIEESGANFDAPVINTFSNSPVKRAPETRTLPDDRPKIVRDGERGRIGEGGLIKRRKQRENSRDEALGKMSTRPERGARPERGDRADRTDRPQRGPKPFGTANPAGKGRAKESRPIEPPGQRKANVWMAPGSRPIGTGRAAAEKAEVEARKAARKASYPRSGRTEFTRPEDDGPRPERPRGDRPDFKRADGAGAGRPRDGKPAFKPLDGDRPRPERPRGDRPDLKRTDDAGAVQPRIGKPAFKRPDRDGPRPERSRGDRPDFKGAKTADAGSERLRGGKPSFKRPEGDGPRTERPRSEKPRPDKRKSDGPGERAFKPGPKIAGRPPRREDSRKPGGSPRPRGGPKRP